MSKRVVITGYGTISPIGNSTEDYIQSLKDGVCGIDHITRFDPSDYSTRIAAEVKNPDFSDIMDPKEVRRTSRFIAFAVKAAMEALNHSGLEINDANANDIGVEIGSGIGGIDVFEETTRTLINRGPAKVSPFTVPMMIIDMASGMVSIKTGAKGPNASTVTACASSTHSIGNAMRIIQSGHATAMIAGGSEACITPVGVASFCAARSLSQNEDPKTACRPFDADRDGFIMGEGAGILILEELEYAKKRGATIHGELVGFGSSGDAYHITAPAVDGEGAQRAVKSAIADANIQASDIDYINAHGTSTKLNDRNESIAIKTILGDHAQNVSISSTKSMTGHLLGAAGAIEIIASLGAMRDGFIPPTINYHTQDEECDLNYTPNEAIEKDVSVIMSNSFGFGGHNAVLIAKKYTD